MRADIIPEQLQDFALIHEDNIISCTLIDKYPERDGRLPREVIDKNILDISKYAQFSIYEPIYHWKPTEFDKFTKGYEQLGIYLGVAQYTGQALFFWVVT